MPRSAAKKRLDRFDEYLSAVARIKGPAPTNPFKWLRLNANMTLAELCEATGVSKQAAIRLEQGTYAEPIERVMNYWIQNASRFNEDADYVSLMGRYERYQETIRKRHARLFGNMPMLSEFRSDLTKHPFITLRSMWTHPETNDALGTMSVTECAKLLCVPQSVLDHFNGNIVRQGSVPKPLINALKENGYSGQEIIIFEDAYRNHRQFMVNGVTPEDVASAQRVHNDPPVGTIASSDWLKQVLHEVENA